MDRRLLIIPVVIVIGIAVLLSGALNFSNDDVPAEMEEMVTEEPEIIYQSADMNDTDLNESVVENETNPNLGGSVGGMGGGGMSATKTVTTPSTDTSTIDDTKEDTTEDTESKIYYIKVEN
ncbi:hypothetical protein [Methanolobus chelungpuianus]|uniref:Uncharacterized protein n=1 Tax=Methanolobus chelungpuianus TaxID=502115 RepID=A0AAE3HB76_9EURY|nr:hypothetical protein [Methanolobus chelungpuianus]MCQ6962913.1 hypothetical protein [Methanolobus chelungpuianus]